MAWFDKVKRALNKRYFTFETQSGEDETEELGPEEITFLSTITILAAVALAIAIYAIWCNWPTKSVPEKPNNQSDIASGIEMIEMSNVNQRPKLKETITENK